MGDAENSQISQTERMFLALKKMKSKLHALESARREPIAVIGIGCRFPKQSNSPDAFWHLLSNGIDAIVEVPATRWDVNRYYDGNPDAPGKMYTRYGGFLESVDQFDPQFFGISPREANKMDPQHRLFLEVCWEALENAGIAAETLDESQTGVFAGISTSDYLQMYVRQTDPEALDAYFATGSSASTVAGRVSYLLGLQGPSLAVDTACSSSLIALHLACQSLRVKECNMALVGGVNLILSPWYTINFCKARMLAADGHCKAFDAAADGYVRGEGCGVVVLKRLNDAIADHDNILALIRGSAVNQDGRSGGLTAPNGPAQEAVIRGALAAAGVRANELDYVEAHGTGTSLGDPIEMNSLGEVLREGRSAEQFCYVGSVKTNIGHLEAAAGAASFIKTVLALKHQRIPAHLNFANPSPYINWQQIPLQVPTRTIEWQVQDKKRIAGLSSFGFSGTNVHVVLEEAPSIEQTSVGERPWDIMCVSGKTPRALSQNAENFQHYLAQTATPLADVCFTANSGRCHFEQRLAIIARNAQQASEKLAAFSTNQAAHGVHYAEIAVAPPQQIAFVFSGEKSQHPYMGHNLYLTMPAFRKIVDACDEYLQAQHQCSALQLMYANTANENRYSDSAYTRPALFAVEYALATLWQSWGIQPTLVMGEDIGEYVAACIAGIFSWQDALNLLMGNEQVAQAINYQTPQLKFIADGKILTNEVAQASYWQSKNALCSIAANMQTMHDQGVEVVIDMGARPLLLLAGRKYHPDAPTMWLPSLQTHVDDWQQLLTGLARLHVCGYPINWQQFARDYPRQRVALPTYPFQRQRYWFTQSKTRQNLSGDNSGHPLLGVRFATAVAKAIFTGNLNTSLCSFIQDHKIHGHIILPATAYLEMGIAAAAHMGSNAPYTVENVSMQQALTLLPNSDKQLQIIMRTTHEQTTSFEIFSNDQEQDKWTLHASGTAVATAPATGAAIPLQKLQRQCQQQLDIANYYADLRQRGLEYGEKFQGIEAIYRHGNDILGKISLPASLHCEAQSYYVHPALLDIALQVFGAVLPATSADAYLPLACRRFSWIRQPEPQLWCHVSVHEHGDSEKVVSGDIYLFTPSGDLCAQIQGLRLQRADRDALGRIGNQQNEDLYQIAWQEQPLANSSTGEQAQRWLVFADQQGLGKTLAETLASHQPAYVVIRGDCYRQRDRYCYELNFRQAEGFRNLCEQIAKDGDSPLHIVHLWNLDIHQDEHASITALQEIGCGSVLHILHSLAATGIKLAMLTLLARGAQCTGERDKKLVPLQAPLWGLGQVIAAEYPKVKCLRIDLDVQSHDHEAKLILEELKTATEAQIAIRGDKRYVARLQTTRIHASKDVLTVPEQPYQLTSSQHGALEKLRFTPLARRQPQAEEVEIRVLATGLNFRDVLNALGMYPGNAGAFGLECAGEITAVGKKVTEFEVGDSVVAMFTPEGAFHKFVTLPAQLVFPKPSSLSYEQAITIPTTFLTAWYGLKHLAGIAKEQKVLIHAAAGGVGMAAVQIARYFGAQIYATAGNPKKRDYLRALGIEHVFDSRSLDFAAAIQKRTGEQGIDIVLNSLAGEFITTSMSLLRDGGHFLELGKAEIWDQQQVAQVKPNICYQAFDLAAICRDDPQALRPIFAKIMQYLQQKILHPLPLRRFSIENTIAAFRYMAQAKHIGKVVISHQATLHPHATYLITGGLGALGLQLSHWLVQHGAKHLLLVDLYSPSTTVEQTLRELQRDGVHIVNMQADISQYRDLEAVFAQATAAMPPIRGVIHAAGLLDDGLLQQQNWERFTKVMLPKIEGAWHLHNLTTEMPLDFFIMFSSAVTTVGSPGQGNYTAANAFLDALAHQRRLLGKPALSINWGPWAQSGMATTLDNRAQNNWQAQGISLLNPDRALALLQKMLYSEKAQIAVLPINWQKFTRQLPATVRAFFQKLSFDSFASPVVSQIAQQLQQASPEQRSELMADHVYNQLIKVLGLNPGHEIGPRRGFFEIGMDSLTAVELKNCLQESLGYDLPATLVFDYGTIEALTNYLLEISGLDKEQSESQPQAPQNMEELLANLENLSEEEAQALLAKKLGT